VHENSDVEENSSASDNTINTSDEALMMSSFSFDGSIAGAFKKAKLLVDGLNYR